MNFIKNNVMGGASNNPNAEAPEFQNAQAIEERDSQSPSSDIAPQINDDPERRTGIKWDMFAEGTGSPEIPLSARERRMSKEWDASKVPPSRFQKREGSINATPASRDGHIDRNKLRAFVEKHTNSGSKERRKSST